MQVLVRTPIAIPYKSNFLSAGIKNICQFTQPILPKVLILLHHILFSFEHESNANMLQLPKDNSNYNFYILWILLLDVYIFENYSETTYRVINIDCPNYICFIFAARHFLFSPHHFNGGKICKLWCLE